MAPRKPRVSIVNAPLLTDYTAVISGKVSRDQQVQLFVKSLKNGKWHKQEPPNIAGKSWLGVAVFGSEFGSEGNEYELVATIGTHIEPNVLDELPTEGVTFSHVHHCKRNGATEVPKTVS